MRGFYFGIIAILAAIQLHAQPASTAQTGPFSVGERALTFSDNGLNVPTVDIAAYYPATAAGNNQPVANGMFPTIAFGHGFNLSFDDYHIICRHLASWGYIVMSPDVQNGFNVDHQEYARELAACLNYMQGEGQNANSDFFGKTDTMTGVLGHSMGGGASGLVPSIYPSIDAISGFAAAETNPSAIAALGSYAGPFQAISGSMDNVAPESSNQIPMYSATTGSKQHLSITGGAHCKFTDGTTICDLVSGGGSITRDEQIYYSKKYVTAFFNYNLKNDLNALPFLCGDSLLADANNGKITYATNYTCTVSVTEMNDYAFDAWPIPSHDELIIRGQGTMSLVGLDGRVHFTRTFSQDEELRLDVSKLARGMYMLVTDQSVKSKLVTLQ